MREKVSLRDELVKMGLLRRFILAVLNDDYPITVCIRDQIRVTAGGSRFDLYVESDANEVVIDGVGEFVGIPRNATVELDIDLPLRDDLGLRLILAEMEENDD